MYQDKRLFIGGQEGYHTFRIPALAVSNNVLLAFCEGRRNSAGDFGDIDMLLKRSLDGGKSWKPLQVIVPGGGNTAGNPAPVVDRDTGLIWLPFTRNPGDVSEQRIVAGQGQRTIWLTWSHDDGATWAEPKEITREVKAPSWTWYATGPCHGIQLRSGRLVVPCDHVVGTGLDYAQSGHSHLMYSDDHGASWKIGGVAQAGTNESVVVETVDGALYLNCRNYQGAKRRAYAWSYDQGKSLTDFGWEETLVEPICQASMVRLTDERSHDRNRILFSNPAAIGRERMTVRISYDECRTWNAGKVLYAGPAAYSDLGVLPDLSICCLFECGEQHPYETITFARFTLDWLTDEADSIRAKSTR